ncbi:hypothetical protein OIU35_07080 [Boseaceae bacterium BT-24-1]|nr:hypothetical protein [Boseaceae bacterium BT-24-1]
MSNPVTEPDVSPDAATIAHIQAQFTALREAGMLSPEGCRLLARAEAVEAANMELADVKRRLAERLREIDREAERARKAMQ